MRQTNVYKLLLAVVYIGLHVGRAYGQSALAHHRQAIVGTWMWYQDIEKPDTSLQAIKPVYADRHWQYVFTPDGKVTEFQHEHALKGVWRLTETHLTIDPNDRPGAQYFPRTDPVIWVNDNLFYQIGQEGEGGVMVFSCFRRIANELRKP